MWIEVNKSTRSEKPLSALSVSAALEQRKQKNINDIYSSPLILKLDKTQS